MSLLNLIFIEDFAPLSKVLDAAWGGALTLHPFGQGSLTAQGVKMEIWAWLLVAFVIASLVLVARNV
jgi:hypothetical protein